MKLEMVNLVPHGDADLRATTRVGFQRLGRKPQLLRDFFDYARLDVTISQ
jgi:hypothetical protein